MARLFMLILTLAAPTLAGIGVVIVLVMGKVATWPIIAAALIGALVAVPVAWLVARRMSELN